jgi:hypothetical protein
MEESGNFLDGDGKDGHFCILEDARMEAALPLVMHITINT